jgi:predicted lipoprotein with Yx(FWY)xxD motif
MSSDALARNRAGRVVIGSSLGAAGVVALAAWSSPMSASLAAASPLPASRHAVHPSRAMYTVKVAAVPGLGRVLVNGQGRTLYTLSSDTGGKVTCTDANGCTKFWPDTALPRGVKHGVAGSGARASLLGTAKAIDGSLDLTYGRSHWPLYTFAGDTRPGEAKGEGITGFGGTWYAITRAGTPVVSAMVATPPTTSSPPTTAAPPPTAPPTTSPPPPPTTSPPPTTAPPTTSAPPPPTTSPPPPAATSPPTTAAPPPTAPPTTTPPVTAPSGIPQGNGGDHDADNNGGPIDGDGGV